MGRIFMVAMMAVLSLNLIRASVPAAPILAAAPVPGVMLAAR